MSDYSDLSSAPESDDDREIKGKGKGKTKQDKYVVKNALKIPRATTYSVQALRDQIHEGDIDLEPEYQRDVVWSEAKQIHLIDSILRNFYIPPVIFAVNMDDDGGEKRTCIDGKQRLTSIQLFLDGIIPHKDPETGEKFWYTAGTGKGANRRVLPDRMRKVFANKQVVCVEYSEVTGEDEREIFTRVQMGMALTPAEKLATISGPRAAFVNEILHKYINEDGLGGNNLEWEQSRGSDFRCLTHACYTMDPQTTSKGGSFAQIEKWLKVQTPMPSELKQNVDRALATFLRIAKDKKLGVPLKSTKVAPIEFIHITHLIGGLVDDEWDDDAISQAISKLRKHVRDKHVDVRNNNKVIATMLTFIAKLRENAPPKRKREPVEPEVPASPPPKRRAPASSFTIALPGRGATMPRELKQEPSSFIPRTSMNSQSSLGYAGNPSGSSYPQAPSGNGQPRASSSSGSAYPQASSSNYPQPMAPSASYTARPPTVSGGYNSTVPPMGYVPADEGYGNAAHTGRNSDYRSQREDANGYGRR